MTTPKGESTDLTDYPRPSVAVDVSVLTVREHALHVVVVQSPRGPALPGTFLHPGERLADAAERALKTKAGIEALEFHQIGMFDAPDRDDRGWALSMAHGAAMPSDRLSDSVATVPVKNSVAQRELAFDHGAMVALSVQDLRRRYAAHVDPAGLLDEFFTLLELRRLYEVVFDRELPKDTFRRHVTGALVGTGRTSTIGGGRPAELYRRAPQMPLPPSSSAVFGTLRHEEIEGQDEIESHEEI